jgi:hypothetical protein
MKSALYILPGPHLMEQASVHSVHALFTHCHLLAEALDRKVAVVWQHNIREDGFVVLVQAHRRSFGHLGKTVQEACNKTVDEIWAYLEELKREKPRTTKKQASGKANRQGSRRSDPEGKRSIRLRKGGCS